MYTYIINRASILTVDFASSVRSRISPTFPMTINNQKLINIESEIVDLISGSPLIPPTILTRSFETDIENEGRVTSNDNIMVRITSVDFIPVSETKDNMDHHWNVSFEIMVIARDFRGHHAILPLIETILFLLSGYKPVNCARAIAPRGVKQVDYDKNSFRYWSLSFDCQIQCHGSWYIDAIEPVPKPVRCMEASCDSLWLGINETNEYNICWKRYRNPGEDFYRFYNSCSQRPGDEIENIFNDITYGEDGPGGVHPWLDPDGTRGVAISFGLFRNQAEDIGNTSTSNRVGTLNLISGSNVINNKTPMRCIGCGR